MTHSILDVLIELGICDAQSTEEIHPRVRDRDDVAVLRCRKSGVIFLSRSDHMALTHYEDMKDFSYWGAAERRHAVAAGIEDNTRRVDQFRAVLANRIWLDVGTGSGAILDMMKPAPARILAVEPQAAARRILETLGYEVFASLDAVPPCTAEVVTLFHVLEHLIDPLQALKTIRQTLKPSGKVIVEVPHANDFLVSFVKSDAFKSFTFWSEHLILHTRNSIRLFLEAAGFQNVMVKGIQRYPLANHLRWISKSQPGGHVQWSLLRSDDLDRAYGNLLASLDMTDTLIATAELPP